MASKNDTKTRDGMGFIGANGEQVQFIDRDEAMQYLERMHNTPGSERPFAVVWRNTEGTPDPEDMKVGEQFFVAELRMSPAWKGEPALAQIMTATMTVEDVEIGPDTVKANCKAKGQTVEITPADANQMAQRLKDYLVVAARGYARNTKGLSAKVAAALVIADLKHRYTLGALMGVAASSLVYAVSLAFF